MQYRGSLAVHANGLFRSSDGSLWIRTDDRGLIHVHRGRADWFAQPDGLSSNNIGTIFEDREGNIWVDTADGLDRFRDRAVPISPPGKGWRMRVSGQCSQPAMEPLVRFVKRRDALERWRGNNLSQAVPGAICRPAVPLANSIHQRSAGSRQQRVACNGRVAFRGRCRPDLGDYAQGRRPLGRNPVWAPGRHSR